MAAASVLEEVVDPLVLHEAAGEREVGLPVLHAVVARLERPVEPELGRDVREHVLQDVGHGQLLEDAARLPARREPERRDELGRVARDLRSAGALAETPDDAAEEARPAPEAQGHGGGLAEQRLERHLSAVGGDEVEVKVEQLRDRLAAEKPGDQQNVGAERRRDAY